MGADDREKDPLLGRVIAGRIELVQLLGAGACGKVYRAHHKGLDKTVAIKVLHKTEGPSSPLALRFKAEARAASRLDHPNSVRILDFGEDGPDGLLYIAMEFLSGVDLQSVLREQGALPAARIGEIMVQVLSALAVAHGEGVIHRDMKPGNIMLLPRVDEAGQAHELVKVCDFGLAKILDVQHDATGAPLTKQGTVLGTPAYMSPEQASGEPTDGLTDIYACGCIMYQMLTGRVPFTAETTAGILIKHIMEAPLPVLQVRPGAAPELAVIAEKAMAKRPQDRYAGAREMLLALREALRRATPSWSVAPPRAPSQIPAPPAPMAEEVGFLDTIRREAPRDPSPSVPPQVEAPRRAVSWPLISAIMGSLALFVAGGAIAYVYSEQRAQSAAEEAVAKALAERGAGQAPTAPPAEAKPPPAEAAAPPPPVEGGEQAKPPEEQRNPATRPPRKNKPPEEGAKPAADAGVMVEQAARPDAAAPDAAPEVPAASPDAAVAADAALQLAGRPPLIKVDNRPLGIGEVQPKLREPELPPGFQLDIDVGNVSVLGGLSANRARDGLLTCEKCMVLARGCLRDMILKSGRPVRGAVKVTARIDNRGSLRELAGKSELAGADRCAESFASARMPKPDTGEGSVKFELAYRTVP